MTDTYCSVWCTFSVYGWQTWKRMTGKQAVELRSKNGFICTIVFIQCWWFASQRKLDKILTLFFLPLQIRRWNAKGVKKKQIAVQFRIQGWPPPLAPQQGPPLPLPPSAPSPLLPSRSASCWGRRACSWSWRWCRASRPPPPPRPPPGDLTPVSSNSPTRTTLASTAPLTKAWGTLGGSRTPTGAWSKAAPSTSSTWPAPSSQVSLTLVL